MKIALRASQEQILSYEDGLMGIAAVPGSGKTWTLSLLAADLIARGDLMDDQEVLVVTLVNSAVDNFYNRVGTFIHKFNLIPNLGYRVRTLHGLAHDIVRDRPSLVGLSDDFRIVDEKETQSIRSEIARAWLQSHPNILEDYLDQGQDENKLDWIRRDQLPGLVQDIMLGVVRHAKDQQISPEKLKERLDNLQIPLALAEMGCDMYADYQQALSYRSGLDFDDLINFALIALQSDDDYLQRLRYRWPYILEDEAQDSSFLQEKILGLLAGENGNWVRVGDPNQAIFETFTTADPKYLREFIKRSDVTERSLAESGRSTKSIVELANHLVEWTQNSHPNAEVRDALQAPPFIELTSLDDPKPNPQNDTTGIYLIVNKYTPQEEILKVVKSVENWVKDNSESTVAVLVPRNQRGFQVVDELRRRNIKFVDSLLQSSSSTRLSSGVLANILNYLADPQSPRKLAIVYEVFRRLDRDDKELWAEVKRTAELIRKLRKVEDFISPAPGSDWLDVLIEMDVPSHVLDSLSDFRRYVRRWQGSVLLPVDQIVLTIAQDVLYEPTELALAHKLAVLLRQSMQMHPAWRLPEFTDELVVIARNERRFLGFSEEDKGFNPDKYPGKVVVSTMHKSKGLEWDRVYLISVNNYNFPSGLQNDRYIAERWYLRDKLNLQAEALSQFEALLSTGEYNWNQEGKASKAARHDYVRERLRLLYVGITRAKRELILTWNTGRRGDAHPAVPFLELNEYWDQHLDRENRNNEFG